MKLDDPNFDPRKGTIRMGCLLFLLLAIAPFIVALVSTPRP